MKSKKYINGSTLILLIIITALISATGMSLMHTAMSFMKIKKANTEIKQSFYLSENGLNTAYVYVYELLCEAVEKSRLKAEEYLELNPGQDSEAEAIYENNCQVFIISNLKNKLSIFKNIEINYNNLYFQNKKLTMRVISSYKSENNIVKETAADMIIEVPDYDENNNDFYDYIYYEKWDIKK